MKTLVSLVFSVWGLFISPSVVMGNEFDYGVRLVYQIGIGDIEEKELSGIEIENYLSVIRQRLDDLGIDYSGVWSREDGRIVVDLPGMDPESEVFNLIGQVSKLEFRLVNEEHNAFEVNQTGKIPSGSVLLYMKDGAPVLLNETILMTGDHIVNAKAGYDNQFGRPTIQIELDDAGRKKFYKTTSNNIGKLMGIVYIHSESIIENLSSGPNVEAIVKKEVISIASIRQGLGSRFEISGMDNAEETKMLAVMLRAGSLKETLVLVEKRPLPEDEVEDYYLRIVLYLIGFVVFAVVFIVFAILVTKKRDK